MISTTNTHQFNWISVRPAVSIMTVILWWITVEKQRRFTIAGPLQRTQAKKITTITKVTDRQVYHPLVDALLLNPVLSLN